MLFHRIKFIFLCAAEDMVNRSFVDKKDLIGVVPYTITLKFLDKRSWREKSSARQIPKDFQRPLCDFGKSTFSYKYTLGFNFSTSQLMRRV